MARIILAEDSRTQAAIIRFLLEDGGHQVEICVNGVEALKAAEREPPGAVLTDLDMPEMNGLDLVRALQARGVPAPILLLTTAGSEDIALPALAAGATSYVAKKDMQQLLLGAVQEALLLGRPDAAGELLPRLTCCETNLTLENDLGQAAAAARHLAQLWQTLGIVAAPAAPRAAGAFQSVLVTAMLQGNLELSCEDIQAASEAEGGLAQFVQTRRAMPAYKARRVHVQAKITPAAAVCSIREEGRGFDPELAKAAGSTSDAELDERRSLRLLQAWLDEIRVGAGGHELTLVSRAAR